MALSIDLEPLVDQVVARLKATGVVGGEEPRPPKRAFRAAEVAEMLSVSEREVRDLIVAGELASIRLGRIRLVPLTALDDFLARKLAEAPLDKGVDR